MQKLSQFSDRELEKIIKNMLRRFKNLLRILSIQRRKSLQKMTNPAQLIKKIKISPRKLNPCRAAIQNRTRKEKGKKVTARILILIQTHHPHQQ